MSNNSNPGFVARGSLDLLTAISLTGVFPSLGLSALSADCRFLVSLGGEWDVRLLREPRLPRESDRSRLERLRSGESLALRSRRDLRRSGDRRDRDLGEGERRCREEYRSYDLERRRSRDLDRRDLSRDLERRRLSVDLSRDFTRERFLLLPCSEAALSSDECRDRLSLLSLSFDLS